MKNTLKSPFLLICLSLMAFLCLPFWSQAETANSTKEEEKAAAESTTSTSEAENRLFAMSTPFCTSTQSNGSYSGASGSTTLPSITVPAGNDRLLVVTVHANSAISGVTFGPTNTPMMLAATSEVSGTPLIRTDIWILPLGSGAAVTGQAIINATDASTPTSSKYLGGGATCFSDIDQTSPTGSTANNSAFGSLTSTVSVPSTIGEKVVDAFSASQGSFSAPSVGSNIYSFGTGGIGGGGLNQLSSGSVTATANPTAITRTLGFAANLAHVAVALKPVGSGPDPIPTMSQWGLIILGLLVLNLGVFFLYKKRDLFA
ncbi:MAG: IPTL-CTERM sorting domain-containing protein [Bacteroidota bacterium]